MKQPKQEDVLAALNALDQFASQTPLPRPWHAQWQGLFQQVVAKVQAVAAETPAEKGESPDQPKET